VMLSIAAVILFAFGCYHNNVPLMLASMLVLILRANDGDE